MKSFAVCFIVVLPRLEVPAGIEPAMQPYKGCSIPFTYRTKLERLVGVEPTLLAWKAAVLPLNTTDAKMCGLGTFTPLRTPTVASCVTQAPSRTRHHLLLPTLAVIAATAGGASAGPRVTDLSLDALLVYGFELLCELLASLCHES